MSELNDIAGSDDIISFTCESQETFNEHSYRGKQIANRNNKSTPTKEQTKENQKPIKQVVDEELDEIPSDAQHSSISTMNNEVSAELPSSITNDTQNSLLSEKPFVIRPQGTPSTIADERSRSPNKDLRVIDEQKQEENDSSLKRKSDIGTNGLDASATGNNLHLYISPSTSLLETTNDDAQPNPANISTTEAAENNKVSDNPPKYEPMDTTDAQVSLGSDGIIDSQPNYAPSVETTSVVDKSAKVSSPDQPKSTKSSTAKAVYSLSQPAMNKFDSILTKLTKNSPLQSTTSKQSNETESNVTVREEEELFIKESVSKILRRYAVKIDKNGRTISRELLTERTVEENTTTRVESWPPQQKKDRPSLTKVNRTTESTKNKPSKPTVSKRKTKSLKPTSTIVSPKRSTAIRSDDEEVSKAHDENKSSDEEQKDEKNNVKDNQEDTNDESAPTDDVSGEEFVPALNGATGQSFGKGSRVFAKWTDGHFYPGIIGNTNGDKYMINFDDGGKRCIKTQDIISQSYLEPNQGVLAQNQDGYLNRGIVKRIIKKKKTGNIGYVVEKDGKEKWYPLRFVSLTAEQAEHLPTINSIMEASNIVVQGKRKRTLTAPQSPNKKTKSSIDPSPNKNQRTTFTPTRRTKLFNSMYFLFTGFNDDMYRRHKIEDIIESHGGRVIEKMPPPSRRENVYLISDIARKTAKYFEAKKLNIPCVNYAWIDESIDSGEVQDWEKHKLVLPDKTSKLNNDEDDAETED